MWPILTVSWVNTGWERPGATQGASPPHSDFLPLVTASGLFQIFYQDPTGYFFHSRQVYSLARIPRENQCSWGAYSNPRQERRMEIVNFLDSRFCVSVAKELIKMHSGCTSYPYTPLSPLCFGFPLFLVLASFWVGHCCNASGRPSLCIWGSFYICWLESCSISGVIYLGFCR